MGEKRTIVVIVADELSIFNKVDSGKTASDSNASQVLSISQGGTLYNTLKGWHANSQSEEGEDKGVVVVVVVVKGIQVTENDNSLVGQSGWLLTRERNE